MLKSAVEENCRWYWMSWEDAFPAVIQPMKPSEGS